MLFLHHRRLFLLCQLEVTLSEVCQVWMVSYCFYCVSSTWMSPHLLLTNSTSSRFSVPHLFSGLPDSTAELSDLLSVWSVSAHFTARLCSISRENLWQKSDFWSRCGCFSEGMCRTEIQPAFVQVLIQIRALESLFASLQKISWAYSSLLHKPQPISTVSGEINILNKGGIQSTNVIYGRRRAETLIHLEMDSMPSSN